MNKAKHYRSKLSLFLALFFACCAISVAQTPKQIEDRLDEELTRLGEFGRRIEERDSASKRQSNAKILMMLQAVGDRDDVLRHDFSRLKGKMWVSSSPDGKLRIYSWDDQTGGTMRFFNSVFQFKDKEGDVHSFSKKADPQKGASPFFHGIVQTDLPGRTVYLAEYTMIVSSLLTSHGLQAFAPEDRRLSSVEIFQTPDGASEIVELQFDFSSVFGRPERPVSLFDFGPQNECFTHPVIAESEEPPFGGKVTEDTVAYVLEGARFVIGKDDACAVK